MSGLECIASGLNFPTSFAVGPDETFYLAESGLPFDGAPAGGRVWRIRAGHAPECLWKDLRAPVNGLTLDGDRLYLSEGGNPGRLSALNLRTGSWSVILDGLPGGGNYHTNQVAVGPDGWLYFGQGAATNSGIVGPDGRDLSWLRRMDHAHDIPGRDVVLTGWNATAVWSEEGAERGAVTGAFQPFGMATTAGQRIPGRVPCTAAVMRCRRDGTGLELVAWGLRNPYGLGFLPDGRLLAIDIGLNDRGSRPVGNAPECLYEVVAGRWYGWPDFAAGRPVTEPDYLPRRGQPPAFLLANHEELGEPPRPLLTLPAHAAPTRFAVGSSGDELWMTLFGDKRPVTGPEGPRCGRQVVRVDLGTGTVTPLAGPQFARPIDVAYAGGAIHILDFGEYEMLAGGGLRAKAGTGALWRWRPGVGT